MHVDFVKWFCLKERVDLRLKYFGYLHQINTIMFHIISAINLTKFQLSTPIIATVSLFGSVIYSLADPHF